MSVSVLQLYPCLRPNLSIFHTSLTHCYVPCLIPYYYVKLFLPGMLNCAAEVRDNHLYYRSESQIALFHAVLLCPVSCEQFESNAANLEIFYLLCCLN